MPDSTFLEAFSELTRRPFTAQMRLNGDLSMKSEIQSLKIRFDFWNNQKRRSTWFFFAFFSIFSRNSTVFTQNYSNANPLLFHSLIPFSSQTFFQRCQMSSRKTGNLFADPWLERILATLGLTLYEEEKGSWKNRCCCCGRFLIKPKASLHIITCPFERAPLFYSDLSIYPRKKKRSSKSMRGAKNYDQFNPPQE